ncbi:MAG: 4-hydroxybenzoyl-CoA reductase subunit beta [Caldimonas sp.]
MDRLPPFALHRPASVADATRLLAGNGARPLAGGTDLLPNLRRGLGQPTTLVELGGIAGLDAIVRGAEGIEIGAGVTLAALAADAGFSGSAAALAEAARAVAAPAHRNAATLGGNLCQDTRCVFYNQSEWWRAANDWCLKHGGTTCHVAPQGSRCHAAFSGDLAPALIALDADVTLASTRGTRRLPLADLYRNDGAAHLALEPDELLVSVLLPHAPAGARSGYRKARVRGALEYPLAGVAIALVADGPRIGAIVVAITGLNPLPLRLQGTEAFVGRTVDEGLLAELGKLVAKQAQPMRTTATPANHRRQVAAVLAGRLLRELADPAPGAGEPRDAGCA